MKAFWRDILVVLIVAAVKIALYFAVISGAEGPVFTSHGFIRSNDHGEYVSPIDNLAETGVYSLRQGGEPYAGRLPGFVFPHILFRILFSEEAALLLLGIFIAGMSLWASVALFRLMLRHTGSIVWSGMALLAVQGLPYYFHWDWTLHPNSLALSCLLLALDFSDRYFRDKKNVLLLAAGFFMAWLFMLRGVTVLFIPVATVCILVFMKRDGMSLRLTVSGLCLFLLPLIVAETAWIARNYASLGRFIPLQTSFVPGVSSDYREYDHNSRTKMSLMVLRELIDCWGGDNFWYFKGGDMNWFVDAGNAVPAETQFRDIVFGGGLTAVKLESLKKDVLFSFADEGDQRSLDSLENVIIRKSQEYRSAFISEHPFYAYTAAPFYRLRNFLVKNPAQDWPGPSFESAGTPGKLLKLGSVALYAAGLLLFPLALFARGIKCPLTIMCVLLVFAAVFTFGFLINTAHYSYFIYGYAPVWITVCIAGCGITKKLSSPARKAADGKNNSDKNRLQDDLSYMQQ